MNRSPLETWKLVSVAFLAGAIATALVPETVPLLGAIGQQFHVQGVQLGWIVSLPTVACAVGALAFGTVVDRVGDVRLLLAGMALVILGDIGVSLSPGLHWLYAARSFQGLGYVCITVAGPTFIQRVTTGDTRRAAMAFWAAHTPVGFASAVLFGAELLAAGISWRVSFLGHAAGALIIGLAVLMLPRASASTGLSRSAGTSKVLRSARSHAVAAGALAAGMLQVSVMALVPTLLAAAHRTSGTQSALVICAAMLANWLGSMLVVATPLRHRPVVALPVSATAAALFAFVVVSDSAPGFTLEVASVLLFCATIGTANSFIWSLLPAAVPSAEAAGATAGLVTQGSYIGVLIGPPTFFLILHQGPWPIAGLSVALTLLMVTPLFAHACAVRSEVHGTLHTANSH